MALVCSGKMVNLTLLPALSWTKGPDKLYIADLLIS